MSSEKIIALYERLSREDENLGESYSIQNQKKLLEDFCREKGWTRFRHFTDDGISGTTFERPSFKEMISLVEDGEVETIVLKDMSRLGRDYLVVGQLREFFRKKGVEHPMVDAHYIEWIAIETSKGVQRKKLKPEQAPKAEFMLTDGESVEAVYAYCNLHGLWKA